MLGYWDHHVKEAVEMWLSKNNVNRDSGFTLSQAQTPITNMLKKKKDQAVAAVFVSSPTMSQGFGQV
jgi:hypothetical protein